MLPPTGLRTRRRRLGTNQNIHLLLSYLCLSQTTKNRFAVAWPWPGQSGHGRAMDGPWPGHGPAKARLALAGPCWPDWPRQTGPNSQGRPTSQAEPAIHSPYCLQVPKCTAKNSRCLGFRYVVVGSAANRRFLWVSGGPGSPRNHAKKWSQSPPSFGMALGPLELLRTGFGDKAKWFPKWSAGLFFCETSIARRAPSS